MSSCVVCCLYVHERSLEDMIGCHSVRQTARKLSCSQHLSLQRSALFCLCFLSVVKIAAAKNGQASMESCVFDAALDLLPFGIFICNVMTHKCFKCITFPFPVFFSGGGTPSKTTCVMGWVCLTPLSLHKHSHPTSKNKANMLKRMHAKPVKSAKKKKNFKTGYLARN